MLTKDQISAAPSSLDETDIAMITTVIRGSEKYKANPAFYADVVTKVEDLDGTVQAKMVNAAMDAIEALGIGVVEIDQRKVGGSDGLYYSQILERNALIDYIIGTMYPEYFESVAVIVDENGNIVTSSSYKTAQREVPDIWG
jgi:hypothetical protein